MHTERLRPLIQGPSIQVSIRFSGHRDPPYQQGYNGDIERYAQTVKRLTNANLLASGAPRHQTANCINYVVVTTPYVVYGDNTLTPREQLGYPRPSLTMLVPFWSPGFIHVTREERVRNTHPTLTGRPITMVGYDLSTHGSYLVITSERATPISRKWLTRST